MKNLAVSKLVRNAVGEPRCPHCGEWNPTDAGYCEMCGVKLIDEEGKVVDVESIPDAELFNQAWMLKVAKHTDKFYDSLNLLPLEELKRRTGENAIEPRFIIIDGRQSSGKDSKTDTLVAHIQSIGSYRGNICFQEVSAENFHEVLHAQSWPRKMIQVIACQDATNVKFKEDPEIRDFWRIRQLVKGKTGLSQGLALLIFTCHNWFAFQKQFRVETDAILISDLPTDEYDKREYCRRFIPNPTDQERLKRIGLRKVREPAWKGYAYAVGIGFIYMPRVPAIKPDRTYDTSQPKDDHHWPTLPTLHHAPDGKQAKPTGSHTEFMVSLRKFAIIMFALSLVLLALIFLL